VVPFQNYVWHFRPPTKMTAGCGGHLGRRAEPPDIFVEENHPMTISSTFSSYWANGFNLTIFSSETTGSIATKLWWNDPWMASFQICVRLSRLPTKMAAKLKIEKKGGEKIVMWISHRVLC
jgi:hypothetical protein